MRKKKERPMGRDLTDVPVPPIQAGAEARMDAVRDPGERTNRTVNLDDTIIFDGWL